MADQTSERVDIFPVARHQAGRLCALLHHYQSDLGLERRSSVGHHKCNQLEGSVILRLAEEAAERLLAEIHASMPG